MKKGYLETRQRVDDGHISSVQGMDGIDYYTAGVLYTASPRAILRRGSEEEKERMNNGRFNQLASNVSEWDKLTIDSMISQLERYEAKSDLEQWASWAAPTVGEINRAIVKANCDAADSS